MNRISRNERTSIFFNSLLTKKKQHICNPIMKNKYHKYKFKNDEKKNNTNNLILFQNLQRIK